jgi:hypothetical protein
MSNLTPQVQVAMLCSHSDEDSCVLTEAGHTVSAIRLVVSAATPSKWRDGIVTRVSGDSGWLRVWNHSDLSTLLRTGEPVALHALYGILAVGAERFSVLVD